MMNKTKHSLKALVIVMGSLITSWSFEPPDAFHDFDKSLYQFDIEDSKTLPNNVMPLKWAAIADKYLLELFNQSTSIKCNDSHLVISYADNKSIELEKSLHPYMKCYELWFQSGPYDENELDPAERSQLILTITPVKWNDQTYYFVLVVRIVNRVEQYGVFRIIARQTNRYAIIAKQEESLPSLRLLDKKNEINRKLISDDKLEWIPNICFGNLDLHKNYLIFTNSYVFGVSPNGGGCPRVVKIDWKFNGKKLIPLRLTVPPWDDCLVDEMKTIKREGKEFNINHE